MATEPPNGRRSRKLECGVYTTHIKRKASKYVYPSARIKREASKHKVPIRGVKGGSVENHRKHRRLRNICCYHHSNCTLYGRDRPVRLLSLCLQSRTRTAPNPTRFTSIHIHNVLQYQFVNRGLRHHR